MEDGVSVARPREFGRRDWWEIAKRVKTEIGRDNVSLIAAGVAFYSMLALFPGLAAFVGIYGFFSDPTEIARHLEIMDGLLPDAAYALIANQLADLTAAGRTELGLTSLVGIALAFWSAKAGVNALIVGLNIVYDEVDQRGFFSQLATTLLLTGVMFSFVALAFITIVVIPPVLDLVQMGAIGEWLAAILRWPIVIGALIVALGVLYRFGPNRKQAGAVWASWGAAIATVLWMVGSAAFSLYVANFGSYNETYGALGAVIGLLMWFYLSAFIVLLGAELNAEVERQPEFALARAKS